MQKLQKNKCKIELINDPINRPSKRALRFEERYKRLTTYVDRDLDQQIQQLRDQGHILTMTEFINSAIQEYLRTHFKIEE